MQKKLVKALTPETRGSSSCSNLVVANSSRKARTRMTSRKRKTREISFFTQMRISSEASRRLMWQ